MNPRMVTTLRLVPLDKEDNIPQVWVSLLDLWRRERNPDAHSLFSAW